MKKQKLLLTLSAVSSFTSLPLLAASCGQTESAPKKRVSDPSYAKLGVVRSGINSEYKETEFLMDTSNSYGGWLDKNKEDTAALLIRKSFSGEPVIEKKDVNEGGAIKEVYEIKKPSVWRYKLELASKVILTMKDGSKREFDKDDATLVEKPVNGLYKLAVYKGVSTDPKSINSTAFQDALKDAVALQFEVKKGVKWVDSKGHKTEYEVVPTDFWISYMRTHLLGAKERAAAANGTNVDTKALDKKMTSITSEGSSYYTEKTRYPNRYLFDLFNIDASKIEQEKEFLKDGMVTFHKSEKTDSAHFEQLLKHITSSQEFIAAPSQYIQKVTAEDKIPTLKPYKNSDEAKAFKMDDIKAIPKDNILSRAGIYWYGFNWTDGLYAGPYLYEGYISGSQEERWKINPHYHDAQFVKSPHSIKQSVLKYQGSGGDPVQFKTVLFDEYTKGRVTRLAWSNIPTDKQTDVIKNPEKYGVSYTQSLNKNSLNASQGWNLLPVIIGVEKPNDASVVKSVKETIFYNDNFSKLAYGKTVEEMITDKLKGQSELINLLTGKGVVFRSLLTAAINFDFVASLTTEGQAKMNVMVLAPDSNIGGRDQSSAEIKTPRDAYEKLNTTTYLTTDFKKGTPKTQADYASNFGAQSDVDKLKSPHFEALKAEMKKLLDEAGIKEDEKVKWQQTFRYINWSPTKMEIIFKLLPGLYKELDPRLEMSAVKYERAQAAQWLDQHDNGRSPFTAGGWLYDTNSVGSGIDGMLSTYKATLPFLIVSHPLSSEEDKAKQARFKEAFPAYYKASEDFNKWIEDQKTKGSIELSISNLHDLGKLSLGDLHKLHEHLNTYKIEGDKIVALKPEEQKPTYTDLSALSSRFFNEYVPTLTNQQVIDLVNEMNLYFGTVVDERKTISVKGFSKNLTNDNYAFPYTSADKLWTTDVETKVEYQPVQS
ncbi:putative oligopeptide ABC transporter substrate-binding lipoprotein [Mycoplasmopsis californica]|uniref:Putative oligopeptide ABC transporter substrate-binding lipoprotein n=1 Tax=Mycoplasmopsis californica TaxID=2113 RepID=A0A059XR27_9BACT|nr:variable surface lipoprotein [Mycoplasmopsis californica]AIA29505.1 putative oligopeptide ABC transporter substrate-binding lipoprotein [Mycoplasmopsis californica]